MELGCSRKPFIDSVVMDPWGVNGDASISKADIKKIRGIKSVGTGMDDLLRYGYDNLSLAYEELFRYVPDENLRKLINNDAKIAFIPLQLYDDANLLKYSPYTSVKDVLEDIIPPLIEHGYICLIKEHPGSKQRSGALCANDEAKKYATNFDNVIWIDYNNNAASNVFFYSVSDLIVTVNSSTGFESLFFEKPLIVLGDAVYKLNNVFPSLDEYLNSELDDKKYTADIATLRYFFYNYYLLDIKIFHQPKRLLKKIKMVGELSKCSVGADEIVQWYIDNEFAK